MARPVAIEPASINEALPPFANLSHERKRRERAGVAAGAGGNRNHAIDSQFGAFSRMLVAGDIVENEASVIVNRLDDCRARGECKYDYGNLSRDDDLEIR